jgi:hypothetical protein
MPSYDDIDSIVADVDKRQFAHEAVCAERYQNLRADVAALKEESGQHREALAALTTNTSELPAIKSALAELLASKNKRAGVLALVREIVTIAIGFGGIVAALYEGVFAHAVK